MRTLTTLTLSLIFALSSCSGPDVYEASEILHGTDDISVEIQSWVEDDLEVEDVLGRLQVDRVTAQFRLVNEEDFPMRLLITWDWQDADGIRLRAAASPKAEQQVVLRPEESRSFTFEASTERASKFTAHINYSSPPVQ